MVCNEVDTHKDGREEDHGQNGDIVEESEETCLNITVRFIFRPVTVMLMAQTKN